MANEYALKTSKISHLTVNREERRIIAFRRAQHHCLHILLHMIQFSSCRWQHSIQIQAKRKENNKLCSLCPGSCNSLITGTFWYFHHSKYIHTIKTRRGLESNEIEGNTCLQESTDLSKLIAKICSLHRAAHIITN